MKMYAERKFTIASFVGLLTACLFLSTSAYAQTDSYRVKLGDKEYSSSDLKQYLRIVTRVQVNSDPDAHAQLLDPSTVGEKNLIEILKSIDTDATRFNPISQALAVPSCEFFANTYHDLAAIDCACRTLASGEGLNSEQLFTLATRYANEVLLGRICPLDR
jgi:hypothetical protein